jgi:histidinol-phosphate aminotransferase
LPDPFSPCVEFLTTAIEREHPTLVYLGSPNNPTGVVYTAEAIDSLSARFPETLFLVDEAYHEFGIV